MKKTVFLVFVFILGIAGWLWGASPESDLPLQEGLVWEFQHTFLDLKTEKQIGAAKSVKENLAATELRGIKVVPQVFSFYQPADTLKQKTKSFIFQDASGFQVVARQSLNEPEPGFIPEKFYILKFPLTQGASWKQPAGKLIIHNTIKDTAATVQVPAGTFTDCLLVKKLYFHEKDGEHAIQEGLFWFAPEVGNIKVILKNFPENKEIIQELVSFTK
jgi:hypothetical protein